MNAAWSWAPAVVLGLGAALKAGARQQPSLDLRGPLSAPVPAELLGARGQDLALSDSEVNVAGVDTYLARRHDAAPSAEIGRGSFTVYVGYYGSQTQGRTIHSPKNCLPGAGWEARASSQERVVTASAGSFPVNRYVIQRGGQRALVLYWYQGRGRVQANEYRVKFDLLRDSALLGRSDEATVRVLVPITRSEDEAFEIASRVTVGLVPAVALALPG